MFTATESLEPVIKTITEYQIGIYDPNVDDSCHFYYEAGIYLFLKHRVCKLDRAATFTSNEDARQQFHN